MTAKPIWIFGDLRTERMWNESLKVLVKALPLAKEADAPVAMVLMGASDLGDVDQQQIDLTSCGRHLLLQFVPQRHAVIDKRRKSFCIEIDIGQRGKTGLTGEDIGFVVRPPDFSPLHRHERQPLQGMDQ